MAAVPEHMIVTINGIVRASRQNRRQTGREATPEELAEKLGIPLDELRRAVDVATLKLRSP